MANQDNMTTPKYPEYSAIPTPSETLSVFGTSMGSEHTDQPSYPEDPVNPDVPAPDPKQPKQPEGQAPVDFWEEFKKNPGKMLLSWGMSNPGLAAAIIGVPLLALTDPFNIFGRRPKEEGLNTAGLIASLGIPALVYAGLKKAPDMIAKKISSQLSQTALQSPLQNYPKAQKFINATYTNKTPTRDQEVTTPWSVGKDMLPDGDAKSRADDAYRESYSNALWDTQGIDTIKGVLPYIDKFTDTNLNSGFTALLENPAKYRTTIEDKLFSSPALKDYKGAWQYLPPIIKKRIISSVINTVDPSKQPLEYRILINNLKNNPKMVSEWLDKLYK